ncbi:4-hydroxy-tetrahydrodipicolinate reductase [Bizionia gelidisalsuginis]|uniref:4-hydroxy-tetrahydrodipicolinate reductase n=1 Tax=Bizionia gelidisalsuginis TaxID=291188 RepID=A0ABY3M8X5_9FLAO|nr:4-hydroxy-tetrahydrodipicolinate reductase [Bizionia gelidisalsuginis]TYC10657.1 4-hydroxy-tetrahydrodipicolinate reductase [Bizionia gelidisalsuginis]
MKIALLGYGKMGKTIEALAIKRGHTIVLKCDDTSENDLKNADIAIDFSIPEAAFNNISKCLNNNTPIVSGTTGWLDKYNDAVALCKDKDGAFIYASNFSLGVTIFFELNKTLAKMMSNLKEYTIDLEEIHHTQKLDAPSGTAITLAESIIDNHQKYTQWKLDSNAENTVSISAKRLDNVPGTHRIKYVSAVDTLEIKHTAHSREGFALGAIVAAEWLVDKTGVFTMKDVLNIR